MSQRQTNPQLARRDVLKAGGIAAAAVAVDRLVGPRSYADTPAPQPKPPNILFVFSDEHRWCSLPFTEMPEVIAPHMARLASQGTRFDNCCANNAVCTPYRGILITGKWPHQSSCISNDYFGNSKVIGVEGPTIAHTFKKAGYATGYVGKWHLDEESVYDAGFDYFKHWLYGDDHWNTKVRDVPSKAPWDEYKQYNAVGMTDHALDFLRANAAGEKPFLLMLSLNPPHWRWDDAPEEFVKLYPEDKIPFRPNVANPNHKAGKQLLYYQHYHAHISAVDHQLGRIMDELKRLGIEDNTIIIYTSDHGSSFGSNGVMNKANPWDESSRVPFIIRWPGHIPADRICDHNLGTIDLYPTMCGFAGIKPPDFCAGQDFSPVMLGKPGPDPESSFLQTVNFQRNYYRTQLDPDKPNMFHPFRGVRTKRHTYVVGADGPWLLYDNQADPFQMKNLINDPEHAALQGRLHAMLVAWLAKAEDPYIPDHLKPASVTERVKTQNRYYSLLPFHKEWANYKTAALAPYVDRANAAQQAELRKAADAIFDEGYFGFYKSFAVEIEGKRRQSQRPVEELKAQLAEHEAAGAAKMRAEAERILSPA